MIHSQDYDNGYRYNFTFQKFSGNFRFGVGQSVLAWPGTEITVLVLELEQSVVPGRLDLRQLGARHCHLIEYSEALSLAQQLARDNHLTGLQFSNAHSGEIANPPKVDLAISETLGNYALEEGMLETLVDARRYLKPGGRILPCALRQFVATVSDPSLQQDIDLWGAVGFGLNLEAARAVGLNNLYVRRIAPGQLGSAGLCWDDLDFSPDAPAPPSRRQQQIRLTPTPQTVHGLALWWECTLVPGIVLSTAPDAPDTHWDQVYLPLLDPVHVEAGDELRITLISDTRAEVGQELRMHPSTRETATIGGFVAGGSGGVGSTRWGMLHEPGHVVGLEMMTKEAEPRLIRIEGPEINRVHHAYGINGVITEVTMPLIHAEDWVDFLVSFRDLHPAATRFAFQPLAGAFLFDFITLKTLVTLNVNGHPGLR